VPTRVIEGEDLYPKRWGFFNLWFTFCCGWTLSERLTAFKHKLLEEVHPENVSPHQEKGGLNS